MAVAANQRTSEGGEPENRQVGDTKEGILKTTREDWKKGGREKTPTINLRKERTQLEKKNLV